MRFILIHITLTPNNIRPILTLILIITNKFFLFAYTDDSEAGGHETPEHEDAEFLRKRAELKLREYERKFQVEQERLAEQARKEGQSRRGKSRRDSDSSRSRSTSRSRSGRRRCSRSRSRRRDKQWRAGRPRSRSFSSSCSRQRSQERQKARVGSRSGATKGGLATGRPAHIRGTRSWNGDCFFTLRPDSSTNRVSFYDAHIKLNSTQ